MARENAGEADILAELRDALALNFGDYGLGTALASLQGAFCWDPLCCPSQVYVLLNIQRASVPSNHSTYAESAVKYFNPASSLCIVRCGREEYRSVWAVSVVSNQPESSRFCVMPPIETCPALPFALPQTLTLMTHLKGRRAMFRLAHLAGGSQRSSPLLSPELRVTAVSYTLRHLTPRCASKQARLRSASVRRRFTSALCWVRTWRGRPPEQRKP